MVVRSGRDGDVTPSLRSHDNAGRRGRPRAERVGFEPTVNLAAHNALAGRPDQPDSGTSPGGAHPTVPPDPRRPLRPTLMRRKLVGGLPAERSRQRRDICPWAAGHPAQHAGRRSSRRRCTCRSGPTDGHEMSRVTRPSAREPGVAAVTLPPATSRRPGRGRHPRRRCRSCPSTPRGIDTPVPGTAWPRRGRRTRPCGNLPAPEPTEVVAPRAGVQAARREARLLSVRRVVSSLQHRGSGGGEAAATTFRHPPATGGCRQRRDGSSRRPGLRPTSDGRSSSPDRPRSPGLGPPRAAAQSRLLRRPR